MACTRFNNATAPDNHKMMTLTDKVVKDKDKYIFLNNNIINNINSHLIIMIGDVLSIDIFKLVGKPWNDNQERNNLNPYGVGRNFGGL